MTGHAVLDLLLAVVLLLYAGSGYRRGVVAGALGLAGIIGGAALGMWLLPGLVHRSSDLSSDDTLRGVVLVAGVLILASVGHGVGFVLGTRVRHQIHAGVVRTGDSVLGALGSVVVIALIMWFAAGAALSAAPPGLARAITGSTILHTVDRVVPTQAGRAFSSFQDTLDRHGFPRVFEGLQREPITPVAPPDAATTHGPGIAKAARSIVKIVGQSSRCHRGQEGSGWVVAPHRVLTNAHVVAGTDHVMIRVGGTGTAQPGRVVIFDPERDLAVLDVPGLQAAPLAQGGALGRSDPAVVAGFPLDGPFRLDAARVRGVLIARGEDIYGRSGVNRQIYSLAGTVQPGNSGGPLLSPSGDVVGTVFARSTQDPGTGYALTLEESRSVVKGAAGANAPVSTGACVPG